MASNGMGADGGAEKREQGIAISFVGLALLVADLLVIFFAPAAYRLGRHTVFSALIIVLGVSGIGLVVWGQALRRAA